MAKRTKNTDYFIKYYVAQTLLYKKLNNKDSTIFYSKLAYTTALNNKMSSALSYNKRLAVHSLWLGENYFKYLEYDSAEIYLKNSLT